MLKESVHFCVGKCGVNNTDKKRMKAGVRSKQRTRIGFGCEPKNP